MNEDAKIEWLLKNGFERCNGRTGEYFSKDFSRGYFRAYVGVGHNKSILEFWPKNENLKVLSVEIEHERSIEVLFMAMIEKINEMMYSLRDARHFIASLQEN